MTGVEAISNGVPRVPASGGKERRSTPREWPPSWSRFSWALPSRACARAAEEETVGSELARAVFGGRGIAYFAVMATMLILVLAANTAYADFPRLASILARDKFLPRQLMNQGCRLAFSNGILVLSVLAAVLIVASAATPLLIPLYMIGVFVSFTLSQGGMEVGPLGQRRAAGHASVPLPAAHGAVARVHRAGGRPPPAQRDAHHRGAAVRGPPVVAQPAPRADGHAAAAGAPLPAGDRDHQRALPNDGARHAAPRIGPPAVPGAAL